MKYFYKAVLIGVICCFTHLVNAQHFTLAEGALNKKAERYFRKDSFAAALPIYSQLLSLYPKEPVLSYKFGVCVLMADRRNTEMPVKYLEFAADKAGVDEDVYYYLGYAYQINYRFTEAIEQFEKFKSNVSKARAGRYDVDRRIEMCNNGKKLLNNISDLYVLEKKVVSLEDFFMSYNFEEFGGYFLAKPERFKTNLDKKLHDNSYVFYSEKNKVIYLSSYGEGKSRNANRDIYRSVQNVFGEWSVPERLSNVINTQYDEDYPFILPDGKTLYFCSKGHNSMGGYDIFKSVYDSKTNTWSEPENLDFAINTPFDDILFVSDSLQRYAYFSSTRNTSEGMLSVYKVRIDRRLKPQPLAEIPKINSKAAFTIEDSTYLNYIKSKANLEVNATEDMFVSIPQPRVNRQQMQTTDVSSQLPVVSNLLQKENISQQTLSGEIENLKKIKNNSRDTLYTEKPPDIAINQLKHVEEEELKYKTNEEAAKKLAEERKIEAEKLKAESDSILVNSEKIEDLSLKKKEEEKANILKEKAIKLEKESEIAEEQVKQIEEAYKYKQKEEEYISKTDLQIKNSNEQKIIIQNYIKDLKRESDDYKQQAKESKNKGVKKMYMSEAMSRDSIISIKQKEEEQLGLKIIHLKQDEDSVKYIMNLESGVSVNSEQGAVNSQQTAIKNQQTAVSSQQTAIRGQEIAKNREPINKNEVSENIKKPQIKEQTEVSNNVSEVTDNKLNIEKENIKKEIISKRGKLDKSIRVIEQYANNSIKAAIRKNNLADKKEQEADSIEIKADKINNIQIKEKEIDKSKELREEASGLRDESLEAFKAYKNLSTEVQKKKIIRADITGKMKDIQKAKDTTELKEKVVGINQQFSEAEKTINPKEIIVKEDFRKAEEKEKEAKVYADKAEKSEREAEKLNDKIESLQKKANKEKNTDKIAKLLKETEKLQDESNQKENEAYDNNIKAKELLAEAKKIKNVAKFQDTLKAQIFINENKPDTIKIRNTDKEKLSKELAAYESQQTKHNKEPIINNEVSENIKEADIKQIANNKATNITYNIQRLQKTSDSLIQSSEIKSKEAVRKGEESEKLIVKANRKRNEKNKIAEIEHANELKKDSATLSEQSVVDKNISEILANKAKVQQNLLATLKPEIKQLNEYISAKNTLEIKNKADDVIQKLNNKAFDNQSMDKDISNEISVIAINKIKKSKTVLNETKRIQGNLEKAQKESNRLKNEVLTASDKSVKQDLQKKYIAKQRSTDSIKKVLTDKYKQGNELKIEASALKTQVDYTESIVKNIIEEQKTVRRMENGEWKKNQITEVSSQTINESQKSNVKNQKATDSIQQVANNNQINNKKDTESKKEKQISINKKTLANKSKDSIADKQIKEYHKNIDDNRNNYSKLKNESTQIKSKIDTAHIKDTTVRVYEYEADYYFRQAIISKKKSDSTTNKMTKAKLLKDANDYELIAIDKQQKAVDIYKAEKTVINQQLGVANQQSAISSQQTAVNNEQSTVSNKQVAVNNQQSAISNQKSAVSNQQTMINNKQSEVSNKQSAVSKQQTAVNNQQTTIISQQAAVGNQQQKVSNPQLAVTNQQTKVSNKPIVNNKADSINKEKETEIKQKKIEVKTETNVKIVKETNTKSDTIKPPILKSEKQNVKVEPQTKVEITRNTIIKPDTNLKSITPTVKFQTNTKNKQDTTKNTTVKEKAKIEVEIVKNIKSEPLSITTIGKPEVIKKEPSTVVNEPLKPTVPAPEPIAGEKIEIIKGLFYSVQIGVYSKPRTEKQLLNIKPLLYEVMGNGNYRYMSGVYSKREDAVNAKNAIAQKGINDAFVVIYMNGKKLSSDEAGKLIKDTSQTFAESNPVTIDNEQITASNEILFKVQIGAFKKPVDILKSNKYLRNSKVKIGRIKTEKGLLLYTAGAFKDFQSAAELKSKIVKSGIRDAFVIALKNNKKIPVPQARNLLKNNKN